MSKIAFRRQHLSLLATLAVGLTSAGCGSDQATEAATATSPSAAAKPAEPAEPAVAPTRGADDKVKVVEGAPPGADERYELAIETAEAAKGEEAKVTIKVLPKKPWHINLDFPTSLKMQAPDGVALAKAVQKKGDAVKLDDDNCEYDVAFTASDTGEKTFSGKFKFAVCQDEACSPVTEDIEFKVAVK